MTKKLASNHISISIQTAPFLSTTGRNVTGNLRYEGYVVDLMDQISQILCFNYTLDVATPTGVARYGGCEDRYNCIGMIDKLHRKVKINFECSKKMNLKNCICLIF